MKFFLAVLLMLGLWLGSSVVIVAPAIGIAWVLAALTDLTLGQASLLTFGYYGLVTWIFNNLYVVPSVSRWLLTYGLTVIGGAVAVLLGLLLRQLLELTLLQGVILTGGAQLLLLYTFLNDLDDQASAHIGRRSIPFPLWESPDFEDFYDEDEEEEVLAPPPPHKPTEKAARKRRARRK